MKQALICTIQSMCCHDCPYVQTSMSISASVSNPIQLYGSSTVLYMQSVPESVNSQCECPNHGNLESIYF